MRIPNWRSWPEMTEVRRGHLAFAACLALSVLLVAPPVGPAATAPEPFPLAPVLGRPTDRSVTLTLVPPSDAEVAIAWGECSGDEADSLPERTVPRVIPKGQPASIEISGLRPDACYLYRVYCRPVGGDHFTEGARGRFRTQRAPGSAFTFTVQADAHVSPGVAKRRTQAYAQTLANVLADRPDFHIDLGDLAHIELTSGRSASSQADAVSRYLSNRAYLAEIGHSVPIYLVVGNHEGEHGWRLAAKGDSLPVWGTLARKLTLPNPFPDGFYSGNSDSSGCCGFPEDYYAWQWGDALFVVIDPFRYTTTRPHSLGVAYGASLNGWDWTLGEDQYNWLFKTLHESHAKWKFVFAHQMTGGVVGPRRGEGYYGRGGIDAARYEVAHHPTFEWGGEDSVGAYVFDRMRPGWAYGPIHQMMVGEGVDIFFRGHDHVFVCESLDGVVYQTCPIPSSPDYGPGFYSPGYFSTGAMVNNGGHLRVTVSQDSVRVDYVRSVLPQDEPLQEGGNKVGNGDVGYSYVLRK
jgi:3',5'-cyclic AMP phosphodiesterase CpdA